MSDIHSILAMGEAVEVSRALFESGVRVLEITLRHETALEAIEAVAKALPDAVVGAGTIISPHQLQQVIDAGATFGVSPGLTPALAKAIKARDWPFLPGTATISEAMAAAEYGFDAVKFFPAEQSGGAGFLKGAGAVLPGLTYCPTGGINLAKAPDYLKLKNVACVGGSWLTPRGADGRIDLDVVRREAAQVAAL